MHSFENNEFWGDVVIGGVVGGGLGEVRQVDLGGRV